MFIDESLIKDVIGNELNLLLHGKVSLLEPISDVDKIIYIEGSVPIPDMHP